MSGKENGMDDIRKFPGRFPEEPYREESEGRRMPGYRGNQRNYREYNMEGAPEEWRNGGANMNYGCPYGNCGAPGTPLPFYMTYPMPMFWEEEDDAIRDLEYFLQLYPQDAQRYQKKISDILDTMDYNGSMIYDEYPDRMALYRLGEDIYNKIRREEEQADEGRAAVERELAAGASARKKDGEETQARVPDGEEAAPEEAAAVSETAAVIPGPQQMQITSRREEEWNHRRDLIQVLLFYEIFRRRHGRGNRIRSASYGGFSAFGGNNGFYKF